MALVLEAQKWYANIFKHYPIKFTQRNLAIAETNIILRVFSEAYKVSGFLQLEKVEFQQSRGEGNNPWGNPSKKKIPLSFADKEPRRDTITISKRKGDPCRSSFFLVHSSWDT